MVLLMVQSTKFGGSHLKTLVGTELRAKLDVAAATDLTTGLACGFYGCFGT